MPSSCFVSLNAGLQTHLPWDLGLDHVIELGSDLDALIFLGILVVLISSLQVSLQ